MSAPVIDAAPETVPEDPKAAGLPATIPDGAHPVRLPVMAIEGMPTADGRYLEVGAISHRALPIPLLAQVRTPDGGDGHDNAWVVGAITEMTRKPGSQVISRETGQPFPEGTFVWEGSKAWMYDDVPGPPDKSAYTLVKDRALSGNSIDLSDTEVEFDYDPEDDNPDARPTLTRMTKGVIGASTLVTMPAFPDAYVEIDGELMVPDGGQVITASAVSWRSAELDDGCAPCAAGLALESTPPDPDGDDQAPPPKHTGGMLALIPADPAALAVDGGEPAEELHLTLAYLGDDVSTLSEAQVTAVHALAQELAMFQGAGSGNAEARVFAHASFNPDGGPDGDTDPCAVYLVGDGELIASLRATAMGQLKDALGADLPLQHEPFVPHITAGYGVDVASLSATGPISFDRVRVALGDEVTDYTIGDQGQPVLVAAGLPSFPYVAFHRPEEDGPTPLTLGPEVDGYREVYGHVAAWGTCHIGYPGKCVTPPRSPSGYAYFHTGSLPTEEGHLAVGRITLGRRDAGGHAPISLNATAAAAHYDRTGIVAAYVRAVDGAHGIWVSGVVPAGRLTDQDLLDFTTSPPSGDWRGVRGNLEMVAVLNVNVAGYPVVRARVASGQQVALVAAGTLAPAVVREFGQGLTKDQRELLAWAAAQRDAQLQSAAWAELEGLVDSGSMLQTLAWVQVNLALNPQYAQTLPAFIRSIADGLVEDGMDEARAVASAVEQARRMCTEDEDAAACAAVAEWDAT